ncbi:MAG TPA: ATP-dependent DNA helicase RecG [Candidatus Hydrogenedentes bacterium]|nr:ATP-dependent DNA helicase RecG [Candidatus Hydrogenedentota bacterium]
MPEFPELNAPVTDLPGVGAARARMLAALGARVMGDLLTLVPRRWIDRSRLHRTGAMPETRDEPVTVIAPVTRTRVARPPGRPPAARVTVDDGSGPLTAWFWGRGYLASALTPGTLLALTGIPRHRRGWCLDNPEYEVLDDGPEPGSRTSPLPVYPLTEGLNQRELRRLIRTALDRYGPQVPETLPESVLREYHLPGRSEAIRFLHRPDTMTEVEAALKRFRFEEALRFQARLLIRRARYREGSKSPRNVQGNRLAFLPSILPYALTGAQRRVIREILEDMAAPRPMARLVQGDVGSGKTVVALHALAAAVDSGLQAAILAPTETLAEQHALSLEPFFYRLGIRATLLTAHTDPYGEARRLLHLGRIDVAIGTHALLQEYTVFQHLGLVIVDEQHRFGVLQRLRLAEKGERPDLLQLSATPIPRSLAAVAAGELDVSVLDELPPGRKPVKTARIPEAKRADMYRWVREQVDAGIQACVVCPAIEGESGAPADQEAPPTALEAHLEYLRRQPPLRDLPMACLHGRMSSPEKRQVFEAFRNGEIAILVATTVVEVGVEAPGAGIMIIEDAWRFGLSQLHQLRGRVGRGSRQDYCFLMGVPPTEEARIRLDILCGYVDGFALAEEDLRLRGPGDLLGARQSGEAALRFPDAFEDPDLLCQTRQLAEDLLAGGRLPAEWLEDGEDTKDLPPGL